MGGISKVLQFRSSLPLLWRKTSILWQQLRQSCRQKSARHASELPLSRL